MREEICQYFKRGNCRLQSGTEAVSVNPTLLNPTNLKWELDPALCAFDSYLPMSCTELDMSFQETVLIRSCQTILKNLISSYQRRQKSVQVYFHLQDVLELLLHRNCHQIWCGGMLLPRSFHRAMQLDPRMQWSTGRPCRSHSVYWNTALDGLWFFLAKVCWRIALLPFVHNPDDVWTATCRSHYFGTFFPKLGQKISSFENVALSPPLSVSVFQSQQGHS